MPTPFPKNKTIKELGIDTTREFVVVEGDENFNTGDILRLLKDDESQSPLFERVSDGIDWYVNLCQLAYAEPQFKRGDRVLVWNDEERKHERIYLTTIEGSKYPYVTVNGGDEDKFIGGEAVYISTWPHISPLPTKTVDDVLAKLSDEDKEVIKKALCKN